MHARQLTTAILLICAAALAPPAQAQTIAIGATTGQPGQTVTIPVALSASTDLTAALLRLDYDPAILESPSVVAGGLLTETHDLDTYAPETGRLNVAIFGLAGAPPLTAQTGTLLDLTFTIKPTATNGQHQIALSSAMITHLGSHAIDIVDFRLMQDSGDRQQFDRFGPQRGRNLVDHRPCHRLGQPRDQKRPSSKRTRQRPRFPSPPPTENDPPRREKVIIQFAHTIHAFLVSVKMTPVGCHGRLARPCDS